MGERNVFQCHPPHQCQFSGVSVRNKEEQPLCLWYEQAFKEMYDFNKNENTLSC